MTSDEGPRTIDTQVRIGNIRLEWSLRSVLHPQLHDPLKQLVEDWLIQRVRHGLEAGRD